MRHLLWLMLFPALVWAAPSEPADNNYALMLKWLDLERQKGKLQSEWSVREDLLKRRLQLLDAEREALQRVLSEGSESTDAIDTRRQALLDEQRFLEREQTQLDSQLSAAVSRAELLQRRLPPPLQTQWSEKLATVTRDEATHSQKLERLLAMYQLLEEFNARVALHKAPLQIAAADGAAPVMVTQIYLGLSQAWYVSETGEQVGYGRPTAQGWKWWHGPAAAQVVGRELDADTLLSMRDMLNNPAAAGFVSLPAATRGD